MILVCDATRVHIMSTSFGVMVYALHRLSLTGALVEMLRRPHSSSLKPLSIYLLEVAHAPCTPGLMLRLRKSLPMQRKSGPNTTATQSAKRRVSKPPAARRIGRPALALRLFAMSHGPSLRSSQAAVLLRHTPRLSSVDWRLDNISSACPCLCWEWRHYTHHSLPPGDI